MEQYFSIVYCILVVCLVEIAPLPTSLVEDVKANEMRENKVKRSHEEFNRLEEHLPREPVAYYSNPTAFKRGVNLKPENIDPQNINDWEQDRDAYSSHDNLPSLVSNLYTTEDNQFDDKSVEEYEKGFQYGTNKEKLDAALENAVLKSEIYGDPTSINQYRYFSGGNEEKRRKRRDAKKLRWDSRLKREVELSPEDILTILTLWENDRQHSPNGYRTSWQRFDPNLDLDGDRDENDLEQDDEGWLDGPVYPHATELNQLPDYPKSNYYYENKPQIFEKRRQWGGFSDKKKRFMVARKRNDPTRELRYLNGPVQNRNNFYTLSQLLSSQREPNIPLYHRLVL